MKASIRHGLHGITGLIAIVLLAVGFAGKTAAAAKAVVALNQLSDTTGSEEVDGEAVSVVMQAALSTSTTITLVDRKELHKALTEMKIAQQGMVSQDSAQKLGRIVGAGYFCSGSLRKSGDKIMATVRIIDIETTLVKLTYAFLKSKDDIEEAGKTLAGQVEKLVGEFDADKREKQDQPRPAPKPIPESWKRPTVMVIIPEMHIRRPQLIDPAGETEIVKRLLAAGFKVIDSEYVRLMKVDQAKAKKTFGSVKTSTQYAAKKKAEVLLYGEAVSEHAAGLGEFEGCRGRIELKAIDVKTDEILVADSAHGGATDLAETVAGKMAIQQAANRLADTFLYSLAEKWNSRTP